MEALVCTQNWLKSTHDSMQVRDYLNDLETYENLGKIIICMYLNLFYYMNSKLSKWLQAIFISFMDNSTSCPTTTIEEPKSVDW